MLRGEGRSDVAKKMTGIKAYVGGWCEQKAGKGSVARFKEGGRAA